ncbi:hypothetical protein RND81_09G162200 [Saponaria officinalis]|uniref:Peptidase A1 domain-containing protein n=1 Tax=Saponaria officinalis TaxID=3572 RepID=A0AAW1INH3_SAPOF
MFLRFGNDIPHLNSQYQQRTPLIIQEPNEYYYLDLRAINVGPETLRINPSVFKLRPDGSGGCFIDSGSSVSFLVNVAYQKFERALKRRIVAENPGITVVSGGRRLCFKQPRPRTRTRFPKVTFHFANNAKFEIEPDAYMMGFTNPNPQVYCLMIVPSNSLTMLGANQQVNHRIIYDIVNSELLFSRTNCFSNN